MYLYTFLTPTNGTWVIEVWANGWGTKPTKFKYKLIDGDKITWI